MVRGVLGALALLGALGSAASHGIMTVPRARDQNAGPDRSPPCGASFATPSPKLHRLAPFFSKGPALRQGKARRSQQLRSSCQCEKKKPRCPSFVRVTLYVCCWVGASNGDAGAPTATLNAGEQTTVRYDLRAQHGGLCEVKIAATEDALADAPALATNNQCRDADSLTVTVPANLAGSAVLQWHWVGDAAPQGYNDCADVTISVPAGTANSAARGGATSDESDCDPEDEECDAGGTKILATVFLILAIFGCVWYFKVRKASEQTDSEEKHPISGAPGAPPPRPPKDASGKPPPIPSRGPQRPLPPRA